MAPKAPPILIVDDNVEFASLLGTLFAEQGLVPILAHTASNAVTLSKVYSPSAVVVDLLLPDMTGHKLLSALKRSGGPHLFVITGVFKGQGQMERVRALAPIQGWYEKPFDTRFLVEQVMKLVGQPVVERKAHRAVETVTADFDINILPPDEDDGIKSSDDLDIEVDVSVDEPNVDESSQKMWESVGRADELAIVVEDLAAELNDHEAGIEIELPASSPRPAVGLEDAATSPAFPRLEPVPLVPPPVPASADGAERTARPRTVSGFGRGENSPTPADFRAGLRAKMRTGPIRSATVARLLTAFHISQETGEIAFERGDERKVVYFSEGRPVYARSNQEPDRIGAVARRAFGLSSEQIERAVAIARKGDRMLGEVLFDQRLLPEAAHHELVREQTRGIIRSLLTWTDGRYVIGFNVSSAIQRAELNEHPASLVVQGVRELFDIERLRKLVPDKMRPMPSPNAPYELHELPLRDPEAMLLLRTTGARTIRQLIDEMHPGLDELGVRAHVYGLLVLGVLFSGRAHSSA